MKSVTKHIQDLTGKRYNMVNFSKLYNKFASSIEDQKIKDLSIEAARYADNTYQRKIDVLRNKVAEELKKESERINGSLPVASYFDACQICKRAFDSNKRDIGVSVLSTHMEKLWKRDKSASLTANEFMRLRDHYRVNYPKSKAASVMDEIGEKGYSDLPMSDLLAIAANIKSQADYEYQVRLHGLASNSPRNKKARQFIIAALSGGKTAQFDDEDEPNWDEDAFLQNAGSLGSETEAIFGGKSLGIFEEEEDAEDAILEAMEAQGYFPNVWYVSDHGNVTLRDISKKARKAQSLSFTEALEDAGIPYETYESNVYVQDTPEARALLAQFPDFEKNVEEFINDIDGKRWLDIPFAGRRPTFKRKAGFGEYREYRYVTLELAGENLKIIPNMKELQEDPPKDIYEVFEDVLENNDGEFVYPSEVGANVDADILRLGNDLYWDSAYTFKDTLDELMSGESVVWAYNGTFEDEGDDEDVDRLYDDDAGHRSSKRKVSQVDYEASIETLRAVETVVENGLEPLEALITSSYGPKSLRRLIGDWVFDIANVVQWAEDSGTGDISSLDFSDIKGQIANFVKRESDESFDIDSLLEEVEAAAIEVAFEAASQNPGEGFDQDEF